MTDQAVISISDLWAGYEADTVLEDVNFDMFQDDYVGLIGPNGGGKTTLIRVILGCCSLTAVKSPSWAPAGKKAAAISVMCPSFRWRTNTSRSASGTVAMGRLKPGLFSNTFLSSHDKEVIEKALEQTSMLDLRKRTMNELSGGQRQRVYISRALATEPKILLLDEPTSSVDSQSSTQLYDLLAELNEHIAILLISHDLTAISTYVKTIGCVNRRLFYHHSKEITEDMLHSAYECPVDLIAHGLPHRVLPSHQHGENHDRTN